MLVPWHPHRWAVWFPSLGAWGHACPGASPPPLGVLWGISMPVGEQNPLWHQEAWWSEVSCDCALAHNSPPNTSTWYFAASLGFGWLSLGLPYVLVIGSSQCPSRMPSFSNLKDKKRLWGFLLNILSLSQILSIPLRTCAFWNPGTEEITFCLFASLVFFHWEQTNNGIFAWKSERVKYGNSRSNICKPFRILPCYRQTVCFTVKRNNLSEVICGTGIVIRCSVCRYCAKGIGFCLLDVPWIPVS